MNTRIILVLLLMAIPCSILAQTQPQYISSTPLPYSSGLVFLEVRVFGNKAYVLSPGGNRIQVYDVSVPTAPVGNGAILQGFGGVPLNGPWDLYVNGNYAYIANYYGNSIEVIDISTPGFTAVGKIAHGTGGASLLNPTSIVIVGTRAYVSAVGGLEILDISNPTMPTHLGTYINNGMTGGSSRSLFISGNYAYHISGDDYLRVVNISNPTAPTLTGSILLPGSLYSVQVVGTYVYVANHKMSSSTLDIVEVTTPSNPSLVSSINYWYLASALVSGNFLYGACPQHALLRRFDLSNPINPSTDYYGSSPGIDNPRGLAVKGSYLYFLNHTGASTALTIHRFAPTATVTHSGLNPCFDNSPKAVTVTTAPASLTSQTTYNGSPTPPTAAGSYTVVTTIADELYIGTATNTMVIGSAPTFSVHPSTAPQTVCPNGAIAPLSVSASGTGTVTYQWYSSAAPTTPIPGATASSYTPPSTTTGTVSYFAKATGTCGTTTSNASAAITVTPNTAIITHPSTATQTVCQNGTVVPLSVSASGTGTLTYQWYSSAAPTTAIPGAAASSYTPPVTTTGPNSYFAKVTGTCGTTTSNASGAITITPSTVINTHPSTSTQTVCQNAATVALSVSASGTGNLTYQWYTTAAPTTPIPGATAQSYIPLSTTPGTKYYFAVATGTCGSATSNISGEITITNATSITTHPSTTPQSVCPTGSLTALTVAGSGTGTLTYQWYSNSISTNSGGTLIAGATSTSYLPPITSPGVRYYYAKATSSCGIGTSNASGAITVNLVAGTITANGNICDGPVYLTAGNGSGWSWGGPSISSSGQAIWAYSEGTYTVIYTTGSGCEAYAEITLSRELCDPTDGCGTCARTKGDISDSDIELDGTSNHVFGVSPNPTTRNEVLVVLTKPAEEDCIVEIFDQLGRVQVQTFIEKGKREKLVQLGTISDGIYFVVIEDNKRTRFRKLIVQRQ